MFLAGAFVAMLWFVTCESPVSTSVKSGDLARTEYAVYTSADKIYDPAWSPDGSQIAFVKQLKATDIFKMSTAGDTVGLVKRFHQYINSSFCSISPDGQYILYMIHSHSSTNRYSRYLYSAAQDTSLLFDHIIPSYFYNVHWSRDSRLFFYEMHENSIPTIKALTLDGSPVFSVALDSTKYWFQNFSVSPNNQDIVWSGSQTNHGWDQLWLYTPEGGQKKLTTAGSMYYYNPAWSPDGNSIAFVSRYYTSPMSSLEIYSIPTNSFHTLADSLYINTDEQIVWSKDGESIYFFGSFNDYNETHSGIWKANLADNSFNLQCSNINSIWQLNTDGSFYTAAFDLEIYRLYSFTIADKKLTLLAPETEDKLSSPAWSPDGAKLVFTQGQTLYTIPATGGNPALLGVQGSNYQYHPDFSPDGSLIVFDSGSNVYTVPANGGQTKVFNSDYHYYYNENLSNPVWSPDGKQIACAYRYDVKDSLIVFDYSEGKLTRVNAWPGRYTDIAWSKPHPTLGSYLLLSLLEAQKGLYDDYELIALNPETGKMIKFLGYGGSFSKYTPIFLYACWAPDAESIAWIQSDSPSGYDSSLNIARIFVDLQ